MTKRNTMFGPMWRGMIDRLRFFADDGGSGGGKSGGESGGSGGAGSGGQPAGSAAGNSAAQDSSFIGSVFDSNGALKDGWTNQFKEEVGDSKYFETAFKKGATVKDMVKELKTLSSLKGRRSIPKEDAPDAEWDEVFKAAGAVEKPEDYGLEFDDDAKADKDFFAHLEKSKFLEGISKTLCSAGIPSRLAGKVASVVMANEKAKFDRNRAAESTYKADVEKGLGNTKYDDAVLHGRAALATLYGHTADVQSKEFNDLNALLTERGLSDHPLIVGMMHRLHSRMNPSAGKVFVKSPGTSVAKPNPNTGPGVNQGHDYIGAMAPLTSQQMNMI